MSVSSPPNRWIPFQCPSCHGLFRLRKSDVGRTGRCPVCGEVVETVARSVVSDQVVEQEIEESKRELLENVSVAQEMTAEEKAAQEAAMKNRRRVYVGEKASSPSGWQDRETRKADAGGGWKIWVSGVMVLVLMGSIGVYYLVSRKAPEAPGVTDLAAQKMLEEYREVAPASQEPEQDEAVDLIDRYASFDIEAIELSVKGFMEAETVEEKKAFIRDRERVSPLMDHQYSREEYVPEGFERMDRNKVSYNGNYVTLTVQNSDFLNRFLTVERVEKGEEISYQVDWESWVGYSELTPEEMREKKQVEPFVIRGVVKSGDYYNYGFSDDKVWLSYGITMGDQEYQFLGYVKRGSELEKILQPIRNVGSVERLVLKVAYPPNARAKDQVEILEVLPSDRWVIVEKTEKENE